MCNTSRRINGLFSKEKTRTTRSPEHSLLAHIVGQNAQASSRLSDAGTKHGMVISEVYRKMVKYARVGLIFYCMYSLRTTDLR